LADVQGRYFHMPVFLLMLVNGCLFLLTTATIIR
jgi:hypothetical protein